MNNEIERPALDWKLIGTLLDAWEGTANDFKSDLLDQFPSLHNSLDALARFVESGARVEAGAQPDA